VESREETPERPGTSILRLAESMSAQSAFKMLKRQPGPPVLVQGANGLRLYDATPVRRRAVEADHTATLADMVREIRPLSLFVVDQLPSTSEEWRSLLGDVEGAKAPGVVVDPTGETTFFSVREISVHAGGRLRSSALARSGRRYVCNQCRPPSYRRPGYGGVPTCPADPRHGTMTED
jgi:hypothetical protein